MKADLDIYPSDLARLRPGPCLSLYQPTHRGAFPHDPQDAIRFRNLVKSLEAGLRNAYPDQDADALLAPFRAVIEDREFWKQSLDGLAVFGAPEFFQVHRLQRPVPERAVVADSFHIKPMLRILQSADRYQVLALTRHTARLFEGNRDALDPIEAAPGVPTTIEEALGAEQTEAQTTAAPYLPGTRGPARYGNRPRKDEVDLAEERFFRAVDRAVADRHSRPSGLPLVLAALPEHQGLFRKLSRNPRLLEAGIEVHPDALDVEELRVRSWEIVLPRYLERLARLVDAFEEGRAKGLGSDDLDRVGEAAAAGRVGALLIDAERHIPGRVDAETGRVERAVSGAAAVDDLLDDLGELVLARGGEVVVVPPERMPVETGLAAVYRF